LFKTANIHDGSPSSSGSDFQTVGPATGKARRPYLLSRQRGTIAGVGLNLVRPIRDFFAVEQLCGVYTIQHSSS